MNMNTYPIDPALRNNANDGGSPEGPIKTDAPR